MGNALLFTGLLLGAAVLGGFVGSCCAKGRRSGDCEARLAELEERLDALATHCMDEGKRLKDRTGSLEDHLQGIFERLYEVEMLVGDTPTGGLLGRVGALEDARSREDLLGRANMRTDNVNVLIDDVQKLKKDLEGLQMVNDEEHRVLRSVLLGGKKESQ